MREREREPMDSTIAVTQFIVDEFVPDIDADELDPAMSGFRAGVGRKP